MPDTAVASPPTAEPAEPERLAIRPWPDPVIDQVGHDPRSAYVEQFWLGVLGPSTIWLMRRIAGRLERSPDGFELDPVETGAALGLAARQGPQSPIRKSLVIDEPQVVDGILALPTQPGLGVQLNRDALERYGSR